MKEHYRKVKKRLQKYYIKQFEKHIRAELNKRVLAEIDKDWDRIHDLIMNGDANAPQLKGLKSYTDLLPKFKDERPNP